MTESPVPASPLTGSSTANLNTTRVTVVVLTYNRKQSLRRTLDALLACEVQGLEVDVRIIDDGSRDGTGELVSELVRNYRGPFRLHYHHQENAGHSAAVNKAIAVTETDLLLMLDDDMVPQPGWVRAMVSAPWGPDVGAVGGRITSPETGTRVARYCRFRRYNEFPTGHGPIAFVNSGNAAYQRRALEDIAGFEKLLLLGGEDIEASWRLVLAGYRLVYQPAAVTLHYHRETVRALYRTFWTRGYSQTIRGLLWGSVPSPTRAQLRGQTFRWYRSWLRCLFLPYEAVRLLSRGARAADALPFAFLAWIQRLAQRGGRIECLRAVLEGRQSLKRSSRVPEDRRPEGVDTPGWAQSRDPGNCKLTIDN